MSSAAATTINNILYFRRGHMPFARTLNRRQSILLTKSVRVDPEKGERHTALARFQSQSNKPHSRYTSDINKTRRQATQLGFFPGLLEIF